MSRQKIEVSREAIIEQAARLFGDQSYRKGEAKLIIFALLGACNWISRWYHPQGKSTAKEIAAMSVQMLAGGYLLPQS